MLTVVEELACVRWHNVRGVATALWAGKRGGRNNHPPIARIRGCSSKGHAADVSTRTEATASMTNVLLAGGEHSERHAHSLRRRT